MNDMLIRSDVASDCIVSPDAHDHHDRAQTIHDGPKSKKQTKEEDREVCRRGAHPLDL